MNSITIAGITISAENQVDVNYAIRAIKFHADLKAVLDTYIAKDFSEESYKDALLIRDQIASELPWMTSLGNPDINQAVAEYLKDTNREQTTNTK